VKQKMEIVWILIVSAVIIIAAFAAGQKRNNRLIAEGKIIKRDISFVETAETFTLTDADFSKMVAALKTIDISGFASWDSKGATQTVTFQSGHGWAAQLNALKNDGDAHRYRFQFTDWQTRRGVPLRLDTMNMLITAIEKMILSLDSNTQVEMTRFKTKSKSSFF